MAVYTYTDYKTKAVVLTVEATDLVAADVVYKSTTGKDPAKQNSVGVTVKI